MQVCSESPPSSSRILLTSHRKRCQHSYSDKPFSQAYTCCYDSQRLPNRRNPLLLQSVACPSSLSTGQCQIQYQGWFRGRLILPPSLYSCHTSMVCALARRMGSRFLHGHHVHDTRPNQQFRRIPRAWNNDRCSTLTYRMDRVPREPIRP